jgi:hypothetical protein
MTGRNDEGEHMPDFIPVALSVGLMVALGFLVRWFGHNRKKYGIERRERAALALSQLLRVCPIRGIKPLRDTETRVGHPLDTSG